MLAFLIIANSSSQAADLEAVLSSAFVTTALCAACMKRFTHVTPLVRFRCRYDGSWYQKKGHVTCLISVFTTPPCWPSDHAHVRRTWRQPTRTSLRRGLQVKVGGKVEQVQHYNMFFLKRSFMFQEIKTLLGCILLGSRLLSCEAKGAIVEVETG